MNTFLTITDTATRLKLHKETVRRMIKRGDLAAITVGRKKEYRIYQASIDKYEEKHVVEVTAE